MHRCPTCGQPLPAAQRLQHALQTYPKATNAELARVLGISRQRVGQLRRAALKPRATA